jgi:hypothetical protein
MKHLHNRTKSGIEVLYCIGFYVILCKESSSLVLENGLRNSVVWEGLVSGLVPRGKVDFRAKMLLVVRIL